ncbi:response regulator transcription factor [Pseudoflavitalea sp. G-6-1-2]|uniref:LytR/AlgR family response regulator transcription factor n=1 Tax=Pseudoflavitalea sp. G-6-1-2 TaxID=2728841 RepID=UPI00146CC490|nr:LytTR family DNA-binding domain-containing protein [Pseudoflavitalea sp. G-6-1-2]NML19708.1 response regulator transcription factor [Pseudoflavitalea sp. G-6-1-2]
MIRSIIIDDEPNSVEALHEMLNRYCTNVQVMGTTDNIRTARDLINLHKPDLVFLDIEMPFGNAFELLNNFPAVTFEVVFVTAFDNYALNAIKFSALDYLLKPVNIKELQQAIKKAEEKIQAKNITSRIDNLLFNLKQPVNSSKRLALPTFEGLIFLDTDDFVRLEASNNYTFIFLKDKTKTVVSRPLKEFESLLDMTNFSRVHHSHIINHNFIKKYHRGRGGYVEMEDGSSIEVSTRKKEEFLAKFI